MKFFLKIQILYGKKEELRQFQNSLQEINPLENWQRTVKTTQKKLPVSLRLFQQPFYHIFMNNAVLDYKVLFRYSEKQTASLQN